jgi:hypothetical protein
LKGLKGKLFGEVALDERDFKDCPKTVALLGGKGKINGRDKKTEAVEIQTQTDVDHVELKLSFPGCKDGRIVSQIKID